MKLLFRPKLAHFLSELSARQLLAAAVAAVVSVETSAAGETVASAERTVVAVEETVASVVVFKFILLQTLPTWSTILHLQSPPTNLGFPSAVYLATDFCSVLSISFRRHIYNFMVEIKPLQSCCTYSLYCQ